MIFNNRIIYTLPLVILFACRSASVGDFVDGYAITADNRKLNLLSFSTTGSLKNFYKQVNNDFGIPNRDSVYLVYRGFNRGWTQDSFILKIEEKIVKDKIESTHVFITLETAGGEDLLRPTTGSREKFQKYFYELYKKNL